MMDTTLSGGVVLDGTGNPWFRADITICHGKIAKIGASQERGRQRIDAKGLVVAPGFIDIHSHSDNALLVNPRAESKIRQGVTTEVIGNCGDSGAPIDETIRNELNRTNALVGQGKVRLDYSSLAEYSSKLSKQGIAVNVAPLVGHSNLRKMIIGYENRPANSQEIKRMKAILSRSMKQGAFGVSSGLIYPPGSYATTTELVELAKVAAAYGGIYASHIRGEGGTLLDAVREAIKIGKESNIPVQISHHKAGGKKNWGKVRQARRIIEDARKNGIDVTCDVYPYVASSFGLVNMLPEETHEGGPERILAQLGSPKFRRQVRVRMERESLASAHWDRTIIAHSPKHREY